MTTKRELSKLKNTKEFMDYVKKKRIEEEEEENDPLKIFKKSIWNVFSQIN